MSALKQRADRAISLKDYMTAIDLYTQALDEASTTEDKRILLANRSLAYGRSNDPYNALQDCDLALSSVYTTPDSPKRLTAKCSFRRAKLRLKMTMYEEAREDFEAFERLCEEGGPSLVQVADQDKAEVKNGINKALSKPIPERVTLLRAVQ
ncbi:hypothetical protein EIP86_011298, partial [Pleurotus ostreatoroseus]